MSPSPAEAICVADPFERADGLTEEELCASSVNTKGCTVGRNLLKLKNDLRLKIEEKEEKRITNGNTYLLGILG